MLPIDLDNLPSDPAELMALLPPEVQMQAQMLAMMAPPEQRDATIAAMPKLIAAVTDGNGDQFAAILTGLGFGDFAPMVWEMARSYVSA